MVKVKVKALRVVSGNMLWFASKPRIWNCLNSYYKQSVHTGAVTGYQRRDFFTKIIDISAESKSFESGFDQKTAYEIRRAMKDGVTTAIETDLDNFVSFYNLFAKTKQLPKLSRNFYNYGSSLAITKAVHHQQDIVMHAYIKDTDLKRVRLLHSASLFRNESDTQAKAVAGRANRLLHFNDMCYFKRSGFEIYDLGGYAPGTEDGALLRINQFKDGFGGVLRQESDYMPIPAVIMAFFKRLKNE